MAGAYPDAPSRRMAWDADGSVLLLVTSSNNNPSTPNTPPPEPWLNGDLSERQAINNENIVGISQLGNDQWYMLGIVFPEERELDGWYQNVYYFEQHWESYSSDTTNCQDGTWSEASVAGTTTTQLADYRDNITSLAHPGIKGVMMMNGSTGVNDTVGFRRVHLYGTISPGETPDRILFLDTENADAEFTKVLDFGDVPRGQTTTRTFKIKNNSASFTINTIQITAEDIYLNAGDWYTFGDDGNTYQATYAAGNLGPGATKLIYLKQIIPDAETLSVQAGRIKVVHASLS